MTRGMNEMSKEDRERLMSELRASLDASIKLLEAEFNEANFDILVNLKTAEEKLRRRAHLKLVPKEGTE